MKKLILIVMDSVGVGALPDAALFGDAGANTVGHIAQRMPLAIPNLLEMGLCRLPGLNLPDAEVNGVYGRAMEKSSGKDTTTGHWEMSGIVMDRPFPTYPDGFPEELINRVEQAIGTHVIGNKPASGTAILDELGEEHLRTGYPIVYTSADSVFQIAAHEELYPREKLYEMSRKIRAILTGNDNVGRVIARPFVGKCKGGFTRTSGRRDFSLEPYRDTILDCLKAAGHDVLAVGKIEDIFAFKGITGSNHAAGNPACIEATKEYLKTAFDGLLFVNLVDFDSAYGHRRDTEGYGHALEEFDRSIPDIKALMGEEDILIITADHGCDPTYTGTDHTREYIPILCWKKGTHGGTDIGTRQTYADIAATVSDFFGLEERFGANSFLDSFDIEKGRS